MWHGTSASELEIYFVLCWHQIHDTNYEDSHGANYEIEFGVPMLGTRFLVLDQRRSDKKFWLGHQNFSIATN